MIKRFHEWISNLKSGSDVALTLFANIVAQLCEDGLLRPDAVAATPSSQKYEAQPNHPIATLSSVVAQMLGVLAVIQPANLGVLLGRAVD